MPAIIGYGGSSMQVVPPAITPSLNQGNEDVEESSDSSVAAPSTSYAVTNNGKTVGAVVDVTA